MTEDKPREISVLPPMKEIAKFYHRPDCAGGEIACSCGLSQLIARLNSSMSDEFWMSFGFLCGGTIGNTVRFGEERTSIAIRHMERVMLELLDRFPDVMFPFKRYLHK